MTVQDPGIPERMEGSVFQLWPKARYEFMLRPSVDDLRGMLDRMAAHCESNPHVTYWNFKVEAASRIDDVSNRP